MVTPAAHVIFRQVARSSRGEDPRLGGRGGGGFEEFYIKWICLTYCRILYNGYFDEN